MRENLKQALLKYNILFEEKNINDFMIFKEKYLKYNQIHNLSTITEDKDIIFKHFIDSLIGLQFLEENKKILDIGCGGGFPSLPLSIMNKNLDITALDSVRKKTDFVNIIKNELNLKNLKVENIRIEDFIKKQGNRANFDYIIARAVAPLNTLIEYSMPFLKIGGKLIAYKGSKVEEEISISKKAMSELKCKISNNIKFYIEEIDRDTYILILEKLGENSTKYPRNQNKPRLSPLI